MLRVVCAVSHRGMRVEAARGDGKIGKTVQKANLPSKVCATCHRPFTWRKKWERCWEEVRFCSKRCRGTAKAPAGEADGDD